MHSINQNKSSYLIITTKGYNANKHTKLDVHNLQLLLNF